MNDVMKIELEAEVTDRNAVKVAMDARYGNTVTTHRHRNDRRSKDARRSWRREEW